MSALARLWPGVIAGAIVVACAGRAFGVEVPVNDYPTAARADYVFACMQTNGRNRDVLMRCSCSIDEIAQILPFEEYETAETLMSVGLRGGENASWLITAPQNKKKIDDLKRAQVEAEFLCF